MKSKKNNRKWSIFVRCYRRNKFPKTDGYGWLDDYVETVLDNTDLRLEMLKSYKNFKKVLTISENTAKIGVNF